jgi:hypothetical protein
MRMQYSLQQPRNGELKTYTLKRGFSNYYSRRFCGTPLMKIAALQDSSCGELSV